MKNILKYAVLLIAIAFVNLQAQGQKVYVANIEGEIDLGIAPYVKRVVQEAEENFAEAIIFRINTFGGRVDAATQIKDAILNSKIKTIAFIDKRAISAGALIALACEQIVMVPGASMGASTVVDQTGAKQSEKYQSYMRSEMRSTAEKNKRRTDIAEGMVDETVVVEGLVDSTKLITLTTEEAIKYGMADTVLTSLDQVMEAYGYKNAESVEVSFNWAEGVVKFLTNPLVSSLLIMVGLLGLFTEIKTPGWGLPGTAALIALALFFGSAYVLELASVIEIILFIVGIVLLLIEIFAIPGFGVFGVLGIIFMVAGLFLGLIADFPKVDWDMISMAIIQLAATLVGTFVFAFLLTKFLPKTNFWNRLILQDNIVATSGYVSSKPSLSHLLGREGSALTDLRPSGTALIDGERTDVVTSGDFITKGANIKVVQVEGSKVVVDEVK